jgi:hypothetical protein
MNDEMERGREENDEERLEYNWNARVYNRMDYYNELFEWYIEFEEHELHTKI